VHQWGTGPPHNHKGVSLWHLSQDPSGKSKAKNMRRRGCRDPQGTHSSTTGNFLAGATKLVWLDPCGFLKDGEYLPHFPAGWNYTRSCGSDTRHASSHLRRNSLYAGYLLCYVLKSRRTVTLINQKKTWCFGYIIMYLVFIYHVLINPYIFSKM
jgi:hypothetical protein